MWSRSQCSCATEARDTRESSCTSEMTGRMDLELSTSVCVKCESLVSEVNNCNSSDAMLFIQIIKCEDASLAQPSGPVPLEFIETSSVCKFQVRNRTGTQTELGFILSTFQHPLSYFVPPSSYKLHYFCTLPLHPTC